MHEVFYSDVLKTFVQAEVVGYEYYNNEVKVWASGLAEARIEVFNHAFLFHGNKELGKEAVLKAPKVMRNAFIRRAESAVREREKELREAEDNLERAQRMVRILDNT